MHPLAVKDIVESVRLRAAQGDCPTEPAQSVEVLEQVILELCKDVARLDSNTILIKGRDEFGEPTSCIHKGLDLRAVIDAAIEESH